MKCRYNKHSFYTLTSTDIKSWLPWNSWSACDCQHQHQTRTRQCPDDTCTGKENEISVCNCTSQGMYQFFIYHSWYDTMIKKKVREKSRECHNHKPQPFPDPKRKRKPTNLNKPNKRTKSIKISSLFPKRGNRNTKRIEKHKNKMTHGKTYNKSPRRIKHKATRSKEQGVRLTPGPPP